MPTCCAINCHNKAKAGNGKTFHLFPHSKKERLAQWIQNVRRLNWKPSKTTVICSDHFEEGCFDRTGQTTRLKSDAVPTVFNFPPHLQKVQRRRKPPACRQYSSSNDDSTQGPSAKYIENDHSYCTTPDSLKRKLEEGIKEQKCTRKKLKIANQQIRRLKTKVKSLSEVIYSLREERLISDAAYDMLSSTFSGVTLELLMRMMKNTSGKLTRDKYSPQLRSFALTLHFYSTKAYNYVREVFDLALPHPSVIRGWYSQIDGEPGFTAEAFKMLKAKAEETEEKQLLCSLLLDEMSIRKELEYDGDSLRGFVDVGASFGDSDERPVASEVLVVMVVSLNSSWKLPIAYFFIKSLTGEERANIVKECLIRLHNACVRVVSLTCDGPSCHFTMAKCLGVNLNMPNEVAPYFIHPCDSTKIYFILDVCHMLKLVRNSWATLRVMVDGNNSFIKWEYITSLHRLQEEEGVRAGNKLRKAHIQWEKQKMKVNLAAQTLSASVADALEFCCFDLKLPEFQGCSGTVKFIRTIDHLFDCLNSRNPFGRGTKAPLKKENENNWRPFMNEALSYLISLTDIKGIPIYLTPKRTGFVGFYVSTLSVLMLAEDLLTGHVPLLRYLLTYKLSQDHLELFFCAVRGRGGWNNNPTVRQFMSAYKRLLMHHQVKTANANCMAQDDTSILTITRSAISGKHSTLDSVDVSLSVKYGFPYPEQSVNLDHDYTEVYVPMTGGLNLQKTSYHTFLDML